MPSDNVVALYTALLDLEKEDRVGKLSLLRMAQAPAEVAAGYSKYLLGKITSSDFDRIVDEANRGGAGG